MYKVGICGHFGWGRELADGQTDKTRAVYKALVKALGEDNVTTLDTCGWKSNPVAMLSGCRRLLKSCRNVIMMPARGGVRVFPAVFEVFNRSFNRRLHYIVIGGWLPEVLEKDKKLFNSVSHLDRVYVELKPMRNALSSLGLDNVLYLPNFRETHSLEEDELVYSGCEPYRLCTFSRVIPEKGVDKAIRAVSAVNRQLGRTAFTLDVFGKIAPEYEAEFLALCEASKDFVSYKGFISTDSSTAELKACFALLFPTTYGGEGFAGTVVDAFAAGVPVIATDWHYNSHVIRHGVDGLIYDPYKDGELERILLEAAANPQRLNGMKKACLSRAKHFEADRAVVTLLNELE